MSNQTASNQPITKAPIPAVHAPIPPLASSPHGNQLASGADPNSWMTIPQPVPNCPKGLEYLSRLNQLFVRQEIDFTKVFLNFESNYEFTILNSLGQYIYTAIEDTDCCTRNCLGRYRPFNMSVLDIYRNEIIHFYRPYRCRIFCFSCCSQIVSLDGVKVGTISKQWSGLIREMFTTSDFFGITFPVDLNVRTKAVLLGACMLINCLYYERDRNRKRR